MTVIHVDRAPEGIPSRAWADLVATKRTDAVDKAIAVPPKVSFDQCYPKELQEKVLREWSSELGFPREVDRPARI